MICAVMQMRVDTCAWLVKNKADPTIQDNSGTSADAMSRMIPAINNVIHNRGNLVASTTWNSAAGAASATVARSIVPITEAYNCWNCKEKNGVHMCSACGEARYCSVECQKTHWKTGGHKAVCKKDAYIITVDPAKSGKSPGENLTGQQLPLYWTGAIPKNVRPGEIFEIKVQVGPTIVTPFMIYDEKRSFLINCRNADIDGGTKAEEFFKQVHEFSAFGGRKAFFRASFMEPGKLSIRKASVFAREW